MHCHISLRGTSRRHKGTFPISFHNLFLSHFNKPFGTAVSSRPKLLNSAQRKIYKKEYFSLKSMILIQKGVTLKKVSLKCGKKIPGHWSLLATGLGDVDLKQREKFLNKFCRRRENEMGHLSNFVKMTYFGQFVFCTLVLFV